MQFIHKTLWKVASILHSDSFCTFSYRYKNSLKPGSSEQTITGWISTWPATHWQAIQNPANTSNRPTKTVNADCGNSPNQCACNFSCSHTLMSDW